MSASGNPQSVDKYHLALWQQAKRILVRGAKRERLFRSRGHVPDLAVQRVLLGCMTKKARFPEFGQRIKGILFRVGGARLYFDDGSFVLAKSDTLERTTSEKRAGEVLDMVAIIKDGELIRATDAHRRGAKNPQMWGHLIEGSFDLFHLRDVPLNLATVLSDFGSRGTRLRDGRQAWALARKHAEARPFRRVHASDERR